MVSNFVSQPPLDFGKQGAKYQRSEKVWNEAFWAPKFTIHQGVEISEKWKDRILEKAINFGGSASTELSQCGYQNGWNF